MGLEYLDVCDTEQEEQQFTIDTAPKANWAIKKIKEARQRRDIFNLSAQEEINYLRDQINDNNKKYESETFYLREALIGYMNNLPTKKSKTQESIEFPSGKLIRKFAKQVLKQEDEKLMEYLEKEKEYDYIRIKKETMWGEFKKLLTIQDGKVVRKDTGEILDCIGIDKKEETLDIE